MHSHVHMHAYGSRMVIPVILHACTHTRSLHLCRHGSCAYMCSHVNSLTCPLCLPRHGLVYVHKHTCVHIPAQTRTHICTHTYLPVLTCMHMPHTSNTYTRLSHTGTHLHAHTPTHKCSHTCKHPHTCSHLLTHGRSHTPHTYAHTHAHDPTPAHTHVHPQACALHTCCHTHTFSLTSRVWVHIDSFRHPRAPLPDGNHVATVALDVPAAVGAWRVVEGPGRAVDDPTPLRMLLQLPAAGCCRERRPRKAGPSLVGKQVAVGLGASAQPSPMVGSSPAKGGHGQGQGHDLSLHGGGVYGRPSRAP